MARRLWSGTVVLVIGVMLVASQDGRSEAQSQAPPDSRTTTRDDQIDLAVTVYNSNIALVRDVRAIDLTRGTGDLHFMDIAATVNPATVHFRSLTEPARVNVVEQNYQYDLLEPAKLLQKYVGREVTLIRRRDNRDEEVRALLLSNNNGPVWKIGNEIVTGMSADHIRFPELPENLYSRPTLIWTLDNTGATRHRVEASYLAGQLTWNADYVLTVARDDRAADLDGWVTVRNNSGTGFRNASLQLVAGDLNRVIQGLPRAQGNITIDGIAAAEKMAQESFSDYHLYTMARKTSINNAETKQVSMLNATSVPVMKRYVVDGQQFYYRNAQHPGSPLKDNVQVFYQLKNEAKAGMGLPMPAGVVRVYQADSRGGLQFVGEDRVNHTPKDETINLKIGNAFDVVCERKQIDFRRISSSVYEFEFEVTLRNHKTTGITVEVNEPIGGSWQMVRSSHDWAKTDAWAAQFNIPVAADGSVTLRYRVRVTY